MVPKRLVAASAFAAAIIVSAPFVQQLFTWISTEWPEQSQALGVAAAALPAGVVLLLVIWRIRDRRVLRYGLTAAGVGLGAGYVRIAELFFTEAFHFVEYGVLAILCYRVWTDVDDWSIVVRPLLAGTIVGSLDEWFQWFIPIRAGEARDVLINLVATACGLLVAVALEPPVRLRLALDRRSRIAVTAWAAATLGVFALFFHTVHVGHDVYDPEIGSFRSRYTAAALADAARDRAARWRDAPPLVQRRLWREDHYLTEALWHVQRRNGAWEAGDALTAWRENRILETFYAPVLDTPTYADPAGHRWTEAQRADAAARVGGTLRPYASDAYAYPLYVWPALF